MTERDDTAPDTVPTDPYGPDPEGIPDPMPEGLQEGAAEQEAAADEGDVNDMEGPAPTG